MYDISLVYSVTFSPSRINLCLNLFESKNHLKKVLKVLLLMWVTVKILNNGTPEIITIIVLQLKPLDFTVQYCVQKMQTE